MAARILLAFSVLTCLFSVFLVIENEKLKPYQDIFKSYLPNYARKLVETSVRFLRTKLFTAKVVQDIDTRIFSKVELSKFKGEGGGNIYLAVLGKVYDVTRGRKHYGPGGGYSGFAGKDGSRAFITGEFNDEGLIEDVDGLTHQDLLGLEGWQAFYEKDYRYLGKLDGAFYDSKGSPTAKMQEVEDKLSEAHEKKKASESETRRFPPCNSEWKKETGTRLWCSSLSGGIDRDWVGVPREFHEPGRRIMRCACVRTTGPPSDDPERKNHKNRGDLENPRFKVYPGCDPDAISCFLEPEP